MNSVKKKVCYVVCYKDPGYIRTQTLTAALRWLANVELIEVRNRYRGPFRYVEVPLRLLFARITKRPDVFVVGFRSQEIFWALYPAMIGKRKVFDEFINIHDYLVSEHKKLSQGSLPIRALDAYMRWVIGRCDKVLTDTAAHAELSSRLYHVDPDKFVPVPVGADEEIFKPLTIKKHKRFTVLFYGSMLPLHGVELILDAVRVLKSEDKLADAKFVFVGGRGNPAMQKKISEFILENKLQDNIETISWVDYAELPKKIAGADLCLGGPFGNTGQAGRVITGKTYQFLAMAQPTVIGKIDNASMFKDKKNCLLIDQGNPQALVDGITWAISNRAKLPEIGRAGQELYEKKFSIEVIAKLLEKTLS